MKVLLSLLLSSVALMSVGCEVSEILGLDAQVDAQRPDEGLDDGAVDRGILDAGAGCAEDRDCDPAQICVQLEAGGRCTPRCTTPDGCPPGKICVTQSAGAGICLSPGPGAGGAACEGPGDCATWICAGGMCAAPCAGGCGDGEICLPLHTQSVCAPAGDGLDERPCARSADCQSGVCRGGYCTTSCPADRDCDNDRVCVDWPRLALCERRCATTAECGSEGYCGPTDRGSVCLPRGAQPPGAPCEGREDCRSAHCFEGVCSARCDMGAPCPEGTRCVVDLAGGACRIVGAAPNGASCDRSGDCISAFCAAGRCTEPCFEQPGACDAGTHCVAFSDGRFCFPECARDTDCGGGMFCTGAFVEGRICFRRGAAAAAASCSTDLQCRSGLCGGDRCLASCAGGLCPGGGRCLDFPSAPLCAEDPRPERAECQRTEDCADPLECVGGRCLPGCDGAGACAPGLRCHAERCHPTCAEDADCPAGRRCNRFDAEGGICQESGDLEAGAACRQSGACRSGLCFDGRCRGVCEAGCAAGAACLSLADSAWCVPAGPQGAGGICARNAECASGLCVGRRCAVGCGAQTPCPEGLACTESRNGAFCLSPCTAAAGCELGEICVAQSPALGLCAMADGAALGEACQAVADCDARAAGCVEGRCRGRCTPGDSCASGQICAPLDAGSWACVSAGLGAPMSPCAAGPECQSGDCYESDAGGRCRMLCEAGACAGGYRCVDLSRRASAPMPACAPVCRAQADCPAGLRCRVDAQGAGACY